MMTVKISRWHESFKDGVSLRTYNEIGKAIRKHGTAKNIRILPNDERSLIDAIDRLNKIN